MKKTFIDKIRLGSGMSLMIGNAPSKLDVAHIGIAKPNLHIEGLGLFESATPNFETYYPDVKNAADIKPDEGDFITPVFRMLSEVIVRKTYNPVDFAMNNVLKNSMGKLLGQTIYPNHEALVGNELGSVSKVFWQESYKTKSGIVVPAGINGIFKIDAKSHPNLARKITMDPPAIHSNSVTVEFEWERSHPSMELDEFRAKMGTYGPDGKLVRRVATLIRNYHETSLVAHGADPFAQVTDDENNISNPEYADSVYSLSMQNKAKPSFYGFSYREDLISLNNNEDHNTNNKNETTMKKITLLASQVFLLTALGVKLEAGKESAEVELTDDLVNKLNDKLKSDSEATNKLAEATTKVTTLTKDLETKTTELTAESAKVTELTAKVTEISGKVETKLTALRDETKRIYTALKADKVEAAILTNIEKADEELLASLQKTYSEELENKFPSKCGDCGSNNVSKASAKLGEDPKGDGKDTSIKLKSDAEVEAEILGETGNKFILDKN